MTSFPEATELLFSYGTLQLESVQLSTFGRALTGTADALPEYRRVAVVLRSGARAWAYVDAQNGPPTT